MLRPGAMGPTTDAMTYQLPGLPRPECKCPDSQMVQFWSAQPK